MEKENKLKLILLGNLLVLLFTFWTFIKSLENKEILKIILSSVGLSIFVFFNITLMISFFKNRNQYNK